MHKSSPMICNFKLQGYKGVQQALFKNTQTKQSEKQNRSIWKKILLFK